MIANWEKGRGRSRKREIGHGWVMGDETDQVMASFMRHDLADASGVRAVVWWLVCSSSSLSLLSLLALALSLSLGVCEFGNHLKVKQKRKWYSGSKGLFYGQSLRFSIWFYFTYAPKHATGCKIFSGNHLHPNKHSLSDFKWGERVINNVFFQNKK